MQTSVHFPKSHSNSIMKNMRQEFVVRDIKHTSKPMENEAKGTYAVDFVLFNGWCLCFLTTICSPKKTRYMPFWSSSTTDLQYNDVVENADYLPQQKHRFFK